MKQYNTYDFNPDTSFVPMQHCCDAPDTIIDADSINDALDLQIEEILENLKNDIKSKFEEELEPLKTTVETINTIDEKIDHIDEDTEEIKEKLESLPDKDHLHHIHDDMEKLNKNLHNTKERIIHEIEKHAIDDMCFCNLATKSDIDKAVEQIKSNTDAKFEEFEDNFFEQFVNLNEQIIKE